jgi:hypothetical protein
MNISSNFYYCKENNLLPQDCPLGYFWLGKLLYVDIFGNCIDLKTSTQFDQNKILNFKKKCGQFLSFFVV